MKKTNYLFMTLVMSILLISCGGKNEKKDGSSAELASSDSDVPLDQLDISADFKYNQYTTKDIKRNDEKENFTGVGVEKDQNDSILNRAEIKNGWLTKYTHRIKKGDRYITISDFTFDNGELKDGFRYKTNDELQSKKHNVEGYDFIQQFVKYKNGNENIEWEISLYPNDIVYLNAVWDEDLGKEAGGYIVSSDEVMGLHLKYPNTLKLKEALSGFQKLTEKDYIKSTGDPDNDYLYIDADNQVISSTLKNLKKEVKGFEYWEK